MFFNKKIAVRKPNSKVNKLKKPKCRNKSIRETLLIQSGTCKGYFHWLCTCFMYYTTLLLYHNLVKFTVKCSSKYRRFLADLNTRIYRISKKPIKRILRNGQYRVKMSFLITKYVYSFRRQRQSSNKTVSASAMPPRNAEAPARKSGGAG